MKKFWTNWNIFYKILKKKNIEIDTTLLLKFDLLKDDTFQYFVEQIPHLVTLSSYLETRDF